MPRGGPREGAGALPSWKHGKTKTIRVPEALADQVLEIARALDKGEALMALQSSFEPDTESKTIDLSRVRVTHVNGEIAVRLEDLIRLGFTISPPALAEIVAARMKRKRSR